jgi:hypothetical protein
MELFYGLRAQKVPVSIQEWLTLLEALAKGLVGPSLLEFYAVSRALLVKHEAHFDAFDQVFEATFRGAPTPVVVSQELQKWLENPRLPRALTPEEMQRIAELRKSLEALREAFEQRMREQKERHDGGSHWVGTGGTSPFGAGGFHPDGIRVGDVGGGMSALQVAAERRFKGYRNDITLDIRSLQLALRRLRRLRRSGTEDELDVEGSVEATCRNSGELELLFQRPRANDAKLLLLLDAGGSMLPFARLVSALFSAAHGLNHFKDFRHYSFHNCVYEHLYTDIEQNVRVPTVEVLKELSSDYDLVVVGDAYMNPGELIYKGGAIDYWHQNETPGIEWLRRLASHFKRAVWLNPMPSRAWGAPSVRMVAAVFPMFPLTVEGIEEAVQSLLRGPAHP